MSLFTDSFTVNHRSLVGYVAVIVEHYGSSEAVQHPTHLYSRSDGRVTIRARDSRNTLTVSLHRTNVRLFKGDGTVEVIQSTGPKSVMHETARGLSAVQRGAARLDLTIPGWAERIDLDTLDLFDGDRCVGGQAARRHYCAAMNDILGMPWSHEQAIDHGFNVTSDVDHWTRVQIRDDLQRQWADEVRARR